MVEHTRTLGFPVAFAIGLGTMIAAGIFSLSGIAVYQIGSTAVVAFVLAAIVAGITAASYSEFASIYSENGGGYLFTSRTFEDRDLLTYSIGMSLFLGYTGTTAFYLATMDHWFFRFLIPESIHFLPHGTFGVLAAILLGVLNARGTEESGSFQVIVTAAKVAVLMVFVGGMFASVGVGPAVGEFTGSFQVEPVGTVSVAALAFITFFGFSAIAASAGEIIEPRKTVPRAIAASIVTVTVLYTFVIVAMVNITNVAGRLARSPDEILQLGETAMGAVAQAFIPVTVAGVEVGTYLIVAGAIFSMISASNASILAASGIGSLMGRQGQAPRRLSRIHPQHGTPFWSTATATGVIVVLIVSFLTLFGEDGMLAPIPVGLETSIAGFAVVIEEFALGLNALTGFATLNLLLPLAFVNGALIYSRRKYPDMERGFEVPGVPVIPILGIIANVALIYNLPVVGVAVGLVLTISLIVVYLLWGGAPDTEELFERTVSARSPITANGGATGPDSDAESATADESDDDRFRILVPAGRLDRAATHVKLAATLGKMYDENPIIQVVNVTHIPEQTPSEMVADDANGRVERITETLGGEDIDVEYTVEGHVCRDIAFDILQTARDDEADLIVMGYPEDHPEIAQEVEYEAPCDVLYAQGFDDPTNVSTVNVGAGGGPHHKAALTLVGAMANAGSHINVINVTPSGEGGTAEDATDTVEQLPENGSIDVQEVSASSVAEGLVSTAAENGGPLIIGATRTRELKRWVFGSTPDRVINLAEGANVPVLVYASETGLSQRLGNRLFPVYRYYKQLTTTRRPRGSEQTTD
ncbi:amino acid permease [Halomicroarcula limicola]|uniref:Amino acid permease n=1 Tax=Haloarcula limicola TaxID=1429915 RepID=A0A8J7Y6C6_9EURY|nr:amino acid permease [Halomicroarcula limicola]MBV0924877.1 amino acid permease [Halomicroarcula limicola]